MESGYEPPVEGDPYVEPSGPTNEMPAVRPSDTWQYPAQPAPPAGGWTGQENSGWPAQPSPWVTQPTGWTGQSATWGGIPGGPTASGASPADPTTNPPAGDEFARGMATGSPVFAAPSTTQWGYPPPPPPPPGIGGTAYYGSPARPARPGSTKRRVLMGAAAAFVATATLVAGIGVGHELWRPASSSALATSPGSSSGSNPGSNNNGGDPFGNNPFGGLPFGGAPSGGTGSPSGTTGGSTSSAPGSPSNLSSIASKVDPGLVDVNTVLGDEGGEAAGTGIVLTSNGEVLTNNHVINGATSISVTDIGNGKTYTASVIGYDRTDDVAVLQLADASGLTTATLGNSSGVSVGEPIVAIGNAGGVGGDPSVAGGKVTDVGQSITASDDDGGNPENLHGLIEINADIQPGDSGGSLVNSSGQVIGIDTAASTGAAFQDETNEGYAIPINAAVGIAQQIVDSQSSGTIHLGKTAFLGVEVSPTASSTGTAGAVIEGAVQGTPAATAGIGDGDVITSFGGTSITSADALTNAIELYHPGDQVSVSWTDSSGHSHTASVTLANGPAA